MTEARVTSLKAHPRAAPAIRRAKAIGGMTGFAVSVLAGLAHGAPFAPTFERALFGGIVAYMLVWAAAVAIWRRVLAGEVVAAVHRARERARATEQGSSE